MAFDRRKTVVSLNQRKTPQLPAFAERARAPTLSASALFERVMLDPANKDLVARTYRRPTASSTSGSELQR